MTKALLFDMGGVVIEIDFDRALRQWAGMSSLSFEQLRQRFEMDEPYERHERGEIAAVEYFAHLRDSLALRGSDGEIALGWNSIYVGEIMDVAKMIRRASQKLPCFAFTNTNPTHQAAYSVLYPELLTVFDRVFASSEMGLRKPERAAFEAISAEINIGLEEILFFDDSIANVEAAALVGLSSVHVRSSEDVNRALTEIGAI